MNQSRRPAGTPVGGQFAPINRPAAGELGLSDADEPVTTSTGAHLSELGRDERIAALRNEIDRAVKGLSSPEGWQAFLESRSKFHNYSLNNAILIGWQKPDASLVAGFNDWKNKHGRSVKKGEKAIWILAPLTRKVEVGSEDAQTESKSRVVGFRSVAVFDVSQTEGPPLPERPRIDAGELGDAVPDGMVEDLTGFVEASGFSISRGATGDAGGWTNFADKSVVISDKSTDAEAARTLAHEAAHIALEHGGRASAYHMRPGGKRPTMEVEAESVAYVLGRSYGMDSIGAKSFDYIGAWAQGDAEKVKKTADAVVAGVKNVLGGIEAARSKKAA
ncbi:MAG: ArdC-like ssDNA-binding domain-containing protein [Acidimicrobiales bacterium]